MPSTPDITALLLAWQAGDQTALDKLLPAVQPELRRIARRHMAGERPGHVLQPTALVNEAYLRLTSAKEVQWQGRAHFFAVAAQVMRRTLVDYARERARVKRGGGAFRISLSDADHLAILQRTDLVALDDALNALEKFDRRKSKVIELRFFGGLSLQETADVLQVSVGTVRRDWSLARAWLYRELGDMARPGDSISADSDV
ncbi:MAG TPA: sigma-70 family RNA polymerase sigma factor [Vicinamibacterales bacterium]|jgi:RNA polymerase sigma factor (TIGR02999 family)|nr:sigma-70 family RNA polymerase sigma factor [Vicinamibacterales bacterium]